MSFTSSLKNSTFTEVVLIVFFKVVLFWILFTFVNIALILFWWWWRGAVLEMKFIAQAMVFVWERAALVNEGMKVQIFHIRDRSVTEPSNQLHLVVNLYRVLNQMIKPRLHLS